MFKTQHKVILIWIWKVVGNVHFFMYCQVLNFFKQFIPNLTKYKNHKQQK